MKTKHSVTFNLVLFILAGTLLLFIGLPAALTVYSSDDYWYSTFFDNGIGQYIDLMRYHYQNFNGRVLVHIVAQVILYLGNLFFCAMCVVFCLFLPLSIKNVETFSIKKTFILMFLSLVGFNLLPLRVFNQGIMWISAFCNYMLPTVMLCGYIMFIEREKKASPMALILLHIYSFLCGATTEQMGVVCTIVPIAFFISEAINERNFLWRYITMLFSVVLGLVTIFLSPATKDRFETETGSGAFNVIQSSIISSFEKSISYIKQAPVMTLMLMVLFLLIGHYLYSKTKNKLSVIIALISSLGLILTMFLPIKIASVIYIFVFFALFVLAVVLFCNKCTVVSILIFSALVSMIIMLPTGSVEARTMLPFFLLVTLCTAFFATLYISDFKKSRLIFLMLFLVIFILPFGIPRIKAYIYNFSIDNINKDYAVLYERTGTLYYCMDYDMQYTGMKAFSDSYFTQKYLESLGFADGKTKVYYYKNNMPIVLCNCERMSFPAIELEEGSYLLPLRDIIESCGGEVEWTNSSIMVALDGAMYSIEYLDKKHSNVTWVDGEGNEHSEIVLRLSGFSSLCFQEKLFTDVFGMQIKRDVENDIIYIEYSNYVVSTYEYS